VACFPTFVEKSDTSKAAAMIADFAEGGMRLLVRHPEWEVGDELNLELHLSLKLDMGNPRPAKGRVLRIEELPDDRAALWTHTVAVQFEEPITLTDAEREALEKRESTFKTP
jgi:PilZ domain-containing protein